MPGFLGTYLSNRKHASSSLLVIPSLSFSARKQVRTKMRFTVALEQVLSACRFLYFTTTSALAVLYGLNGIQSLVLCVMCFIHFQLHLLAFIGWWKHNHSPPRNIPAKPKHQNTGRGRRSADIVTTTRSGAHTDTTLTY